MAKGKQSKMYGYGMVDNFIEKNIGVNLSWAGYWRRYAIELRLEVHPEEESLAAGHDISTNIVLEIHTLHVGGDHNDSANTITIVWDLYMNKYRVP